MMLSCAIDGGHPTVAELAQNLGAEGAWAKIIEGALGEPAAEPPLGFRSMWLRGWPQRPRCALSFRAIRSGLTGLMIFDMPSPSSAVAACR
jgi:hypothetical protein